MSSRLVIKSIISPIWDLFTPISVRHLYDTAHSPLCVQQCSSTCAGGFQRRVVVCQDENGYPANSCEDRSRPNEQRSCESGPCPQWIYGNWGEVRETLLHCSLKLATFPLPDTGLNRKTRVLFANRDGAADVHLWLIPFIASH